MENLNQLLENAYFNDLDDHLIAEIAKTHSHEIAQQYYFEINETYCSITKNNVLQITITPKIFFEKESCLYDNEMLAVEEILKDYAIEIASSIYEIQMSTTLEQAKQFLLTKGFSQSEEFTQFAQF